MSDFPADPTPHGAGRPVFWLLGIAVTGSWTSLLLLFAHLTPPVALALGAAVIGGCAWADTVLFSKSRPD